MKKNAEEFIQEIFFATCGMSDAAYCEFLEEIGEACNSAAEAKRDEMKIPDENS